MSVDIEMRTIRLRSYPLTTNKDSDMPIENECLNRAKEIRERLVQLKDSL